ncbi:MAG: M48 family metallopeptidase [Planctomycetota bacterium]
MNFYFLVVLAFALGFEPRPLEEPAREGMRLLAVGMGTLFLLFSAKGIAVWAISRLRRDFSDRLRIITRFHRLRRLHGLLAVVVFGVMIFFCDWNSLVLYHWRLRGWPIVDELAIIAPYLFAEVVAILCFQSVDETIAEQFAAQGRRPRHHWSRREYLSFQFRTQYGVWLAASLLLTSSRIVFAFFCPSWASSPTIAPIQTGVTSIVVLLLAPVILRLVWRADPLPVGPLRNLLIHLSHKLRFLCDDILVWRTHGGIANAAISGMIPRIRYVMLSDALLEQLSPEEIVSVYGHEVGHVRHHHLSYYFAFIVGSMLFVVLLSACIEGWIQATVEPATWEWFDSYREYAPIEILLLIPYFTFVFGYLSRRFERQADLFGSRTVSQALLDIVGPSVALENPYAINPNSAGTPVAVSVGKAGEPPVIPAGVRVFVQALERVAELNGVTPNLWSWRHGSIAQRIEFLEQVGREPSLGDRFDSSMRKLRWGLALALAAGITVLAFLTPV